MFGKRVKLRIGEDLEIEAHTAEEVRSLVDKAMEFNQQKPLPRKLPPADPSQEQHE